MAMMFDGMTCPLCQEPMHVHEQLFGTWGVWLERSHPLVKYCDGTLHWSCYAQWEHRQTFARSYFEFWVKGRHDNPYWLPAFLDDEVLVTVNPMREISGVWVIVAETGTRDNPRLDDWQRWLSGDDATMHPFKRDVLRSVKGTLREHVPTKETLLAAIDHDS